MNERIFLLNAQTMNQAFKACWEQAKANCLLGEWELAIRERKRSQEQNRKLWACLGDISRQCDLCINGQMVQAATEDWKAVFTAALKREQRIATGVDGGLVFLGTRTSRMRKAEFSELIELIHAYGTQHNVKWSEQALAVYDEYREAA